MNILIKLTKLIIPNNNKKKMNNVKLIFEVN